MPSELVQVFSAAIVRRLIDDSMLEVVRGRADAVAAFVAEEVGRPGPGKQLVSSLAAALLACPDVVELFADDEELLSAVTDLAY